MELEIMLFVLVLLRTVVARGPQEVVLVQDLNSDHDRRHLDAGLPSLLTFNIKRESSNVSLSLTENRRLNANAPVYRIEEDAPGVRNLVEKDVIPIQNVRFYQDVRNIGAFSVRCQLVTDGPCRRILTGNFYIDGRNFDIEPAAQTETELKRGLDVDAFGTPHFLFENEASGEQLPPEIIRSMEILDGKDINDVENKIRDALADNISNEEVKRDLEEDLDELGQTGIMLHTALRKHAYSNALENLPPKHNKHDRQYQAEQKVKKQEYAVEIYIVIDPTVWIKYYEKTKSTGTLTRADVTELKLREHFSLIINGVSLRYEAIEDKQMTMYCTISGFLILQKRDGSNPLPLGKEKTINGKRLVSGEFYIDNTIGKKGWINSLKNLPGNDHIMIFTALDLYGGSLVKMEIGMVGIAYTNGICSDYRVSVNEAVGFFTTTTVAAHELGHNLGAPHDGEKFAERCKSPGDFMMAPYVATFNETDKHSLNPWRFSSCSVQHFKRLFSYLKKSNCLTNPPNEYAHEEYIKHASKLPGEIHDASAQCQLLEGERSKLCKKNDMKKICLVMKCLRAGGTCALYTAARGTKCEGPDTNKLYWCIDGQCVEKSVKVIVERSLPEPTATTSTTEITTTAECTDRGIYDISCKTMRKWYVRLPDFCDSMYGPFCCQTCSIVGSCVDYGYYKYSCGKMLKSFFSNDIDMFCEYYREDCCGTCAPEETTTTTTTTMATTTPVGTDLFQCKGDVGYDDLTCDELEQMHGTQELCTFHTQECCITCGLYCSGNQLVNITGSVYTCDKALIRVFHNHINAFCRVYAKPCCEICLEKLYRK